MIGDVNRRKGIIMGSEQEGDDVIINVSCCAVPLRIGCKQGAASADTCSEQEGDDVIINVSCWLPLVTRGVVHFVRPSR